MLPNPHLRLLRSRVAASCSRWCLVEYLRSPARSGSHRGTPPKPGRCCPAPSQECRLGTEKSRIESLAHTLVESLTPDDVKRKIVRELYLEKYQKAKKALRGWYMQRDAIRERIDEVAPMPPVLRLCGGSGHRPCARQCPNGAMPPRPPLSPSVCRNVSQSRTDFGVVPNVPRDAMGQEHRNSQMTPATTSTTPRRQLLGAADAQTARTATSSTAPVHQPLGSANERHHKAHRPQRPTERSNPTQHAKGRTGDCPGPRKEATTRRTVTQGGWTPPPPQKEHCSCSLLGFRSPTSFLCCVLDYSSAQMRLDGTGLPALRPGCRGHVDAPSPTATGQG